MAQMNPGICICVLTTNRSIVKPFWFAAESRLTPILSKFLQENRG